MSNNTNSNYANSTNNNNNHTHNTNNKNDNNHNMDFRMAASRIDSGVQG